MRSQSDRYGAVAIAIHWTSALLILALLSSGLVAANNSPAPPPVIIAHVAMGTLVLLLTLFRIVWWLTFDKRPNPAADIPGWQVAASRIVHTLLYVVILLMAASGIAFTLLGGVIPTVLGGGSIALPDLLPYPPHTAHWLGARLLIALLVLHIGAALYHWVIRHDSVPARMGLPPDPRQRYLVP
jgi:cytochrome b561